MIVRNATWRQISAATLEKIWGDEEFGLDPSGLLQTQSSNNFTKAYGLTRPVCMNKLIPVRRKSLAVMRFALFPRWIRPRQRAAEPCCVYTGPRRRVCKGTSIQQRPYR